MAPDLSPETVSARRALLDALTALDAHLGSVILVGAQAVYLRTGAASVAIAEYTTDADLAIDARTLSAEPHVEEAMNAAGFVRDPSNDNPGAWVSREGIPVDLMVPNEIAGSGRRGVTAPPHDRGSMRRTRGLEAALVDCEELDVASLEPEDRRRFTIRVAGAAALLVAKLHKVGERQGNLRRLDDKDAHDIYRLLVATDTDSLAATLRMLMSDDVAGGVTREALDYLDELFAAGRDALGSGMAGRAEEGIGDPAQTALAVSLLSSDLLAALRSA